MTSSPTELGKLDEDYTAELRAHLDAARAEAVQRHGTVPGLETATLYSDRLRSLLGWHMDQVAQRLGCPEMAESICMIAVGGFGRFELGFQSDIDFWFLTERKPTPGEEEFIKAALYPLWDLKVDLGYGVYSVRTCLEAMGTDLHRTTSLLETRYLWGDAGLWEELTDRAHSKLRKSHQLWFLQSLEKEMADRHSHFGRTVFLLEPDVKNSPGGLRDLHLSLWIAFSLTGTPGLDMLAENGFISDSEKQRLHQAWSFLIDVRNSLHLSEERRVDKLTLERQIRVAELMGYQREDNVLAEEQLMRDYYDHASMVERLSARVMEKALRLTPGTRQYAGESQPSRRVDRDFWVRGHRIWVEPRTVSEMRVDPFWPLRLFLAGAREGLEFSDNTLRRVEENLDMVDDAYRSAPEARDLFLALLRCRGHAAHTLRAMKRCGFLCAYIPEFEPVRNLPRIDHYHQYTVDEHLIHAVEVAEQLETNPPRGMEHVAEIARELLRPDLLHLALLIHDLGKGEGRAHVIRGMHIAQRVGERLRLRPVETAMLRAIVANHQKMNQMVMKRDLEDPAPAHELASAVQKSEVLRMLYVHSACDLAAVSNESWNDWRGRLLATLFTKTHDVLRGVPTKTPKRTLDQELLEEIWREVQAVENGRDYERSTFDHFIKDMPDRYLRSVPPSDAARHFVMSTEVTHQRRIAFHIDDSHAASYVEITFVATDAPGLFSLLCGALASKRFNILSAQVYTAMSGEAVDIFQVQVPQAFQDRLEETLDRLCLRISQLVRTGEKPDWGRTTDSSPAVPITRERIELRPPRVEIDNELSATHTVVEVRAPDRPGLLSRITSVFDERNINIDLALIATESYQIVDVFYVTDLETNKILDERNLDRLRDALLETIHDSLDIES